MVKLNKKGFTLAELLIVVAVIAVLVAVAIPTFNSQLEKSRQGVDISNLRGAYAAARVAQMDQQVSNASGITEIDADHLAFWYEPDSGELKTGSVIVCGKALTNKVVADTSGLNTTIITYVDTEGSSTVPTNTKGIKVTFKDEDGEGAGTQYVIDKITFADS